MGVKSLLSCNGGDLEGEKLPLDTQQNEYQLMSIFAHFEVHSMIQTRIKNGRGLPYRSIYLVYVELGAFAIGTQAT